MKNIQKGLKDHKTALIIAGTLIIIALLAVYTIFQLSPTQTVSVNGQSEIDVFPDLITMNFLIESVEDTASEAQNLNAEIYDSFVSSLENLGINEEEIKTTNINVRKNYEWINGRQVDKGYIATHNIQIEMDIDETDMLSQVIDTGVNSGALINYINFELSDSLEEEKKAEAIQEATENARLKAENIAEGLNANLGNIVSVSDSNIYYNPSHVYSIEDSAVASDAEAAGESAKAAVSGINPSEQTIQANVRIVYKIR